MKKYLFDLRLRSNEDEDFDYYSSIIKEKSNLFDATFCINDGNKKERIEQFSKVISNICYNMQYSTLVLHFIGHGVCNDESNSYGIEFISWNDFDVELQKIIDNGNFLIVNLMNICYSHKFKDYKAYNKLWYVDCKTNDFCTPFNIYCINNLDFSDYLQEIKRLTNNSEICYHYKEKVIHSL